MPTGKPRIGLFGIMQELYDDMQKEHKFETGKVIVHHWSLTPNVLFPEKA